MATMMPIAKMSILMKGILMAKKPTKKSTTPIVIAMVAMTLMST